MAYMLYIEAKAVQLASPSVQLFTVSPGLDVSAAYAKPEHFRHQAIRDKPCQRLW
jgi:hypothetical protein